LVGEETGIGQLVIVEGSGAAEGAAALREVASAHYRPFLVEVPVTPAHSQALGAALPLVAAMGPIDGASAAYLCADFACQSPVTTPNGLAAQLLPSRT